MAEKKEDSVRISIDIPRELRYKIQDVAFICKKTETELLTQGIAAYIEAIVSKKGEEFKEVMEKLRRLRAE